MESILSQPDILHQIFSFLPVQSLANTSQVCRFWAELVKKVWKYIGLETLVIQLEAIYELNVDAWLDKVFHIGSRFSLFLEKYNIEY